MHKFTTTDYTWTFIISIDCSTIEHFPCVVYSCKREIQLESYVFRSASVILWYKLVYTYCKPIYTSLFGVQLHMSIETHLLYDCILANKLQLHCQQCIVWLDLSWLATLHFSLSFQSIMYAKITEGTTYSSRYPQSSKRRQYFFFYFCWIEDTLMDRTIGQQRILLCQYYYHAYCFTRNYYRIYCQDYYHIYCFMSLLPSSKKKGTWTMGKTFL